MIEVRPALFCILACTVLLQACDKDQDTAAKTPPQGAKQVPATTSEKAATVPGKDTLPPSHPAVDARGNSALPANPLEAMRILKTRLDRNPNDLDTLISFGNAHMMVERFADAAKLYERALVINPKDLDVRANLATAYKYTEKTDQAIAELKKNLAVDPRHGASLYNLGFIYYFDKKDTQSALPLWKQWLTQYPNVPEAEELRGYVAQAEAASTKIKP